MSRSKVDIWNKALKYCGNTNTIADEKENSVEADYCRSFYDDVLDGELSKSAWIFAVKRLSLGLIYDSTKADSNVIPDYAYIYSYPSDCLKPLYILGDYVNEYGVNKNEYKYYRQLGGVISFESRIINLSEFIDDGLGYNNNNKQVIITDKQDAKLEYIFRQEDISTWSAAFREAVGLAIALRIVNPLSQDGGQRMQILAQQYEAMLQNALAINAQSTQQDEVLRVSTTERIRLW